MRTFTWITVFATSLALMGCAEDGTRKPTTNNATPNSNTTTANDANSRTTVSKPAIGSGETPATSATNGTPTNRTAPNGTATDTTRPDNTAVNERDRDPAAVLPTDQGSNQKDTEMVAEIRKRIMQNKQISLNGQNVKTPTVGGKVTLRGPVASDAERKLIEQIAKDVAGADNVTSELEVAP